MVLCFICDQKRRVKGSEPSSGACASCGNGTSDVEVQDAYRFCFVPLFWRSHHEIMCNNCGTLLSQWLLACSRACCKMIKLVARF